MVMVRTVLLCMSWLPSSAEWTDIQLAVPLDVREAVIFVASHGFS